MVLKRLLAVICIVVLIAPTASAAWFSQSVYDYYYDEELYEKIKPGIAGPIPEYVYWRVMEEQETPGVRIVEIFLYWRWQNTTGASHEHDWEFVMLFVDDNDLVYKMAYDKWHYIVGRTLTPTLYNDTHVVLLLNEHYRNITVVESPLSDELVQETLNYTTNYQHITNEILGRAYKEVGFNIDIFDDPMIIFEQSWYGYKKATAFKSFWRSLAVRVDEKTGWFGYGG